MPTKIITSIHELVCYSKNGSLKEDMPLIMITYYQKTEDIQGLAFPRTKTHFEAAFDTTRHNHGTITQGLNKYFNVYAAMHVYYAYVYAS